MKIADLFADQHVDQHVDQDVDQDADDQDDSWLSGLSPEEQDSYLRWEQRSHDLRRSRERRRCFTCRPVTGRVRRVVATLVASERVDATTAYRLTCTHITIDVD